MYQHNKRMTLILKYILNFTMQKLIPLILFILSLFAKEYIAAINFEGISISNDEEFQYE